MVARRAFVQRAFVLVSYEKLASVNSYASEARSLRDGIKLQQGMSHLEVLARMTALLPAFRARVPEAVKLRRLPDATCDDIRTSGLARIFQRCAMADQRLRSN